MISIEYKIFVNSWIRNYRIFSESEDFSQLRTNRFSAKYHNLSKFAWKNMIKKKKNCRKMEKERKFLTSPPMLGNFLHGEGACNPLVNNGGKSQNCFTKTSISRNVRANNDLIRRGREREGSHCRGENRVNAPVETLVKRTFNFRETFRYVFELITLS